MTSTPSERAAMTDEQIEEIFQSVADAGDQVHIRFARAIESALSAVAQTQAVGAVPEGWKLVPIEPTPEMARAGIAVARMDVSGAWVTDARECYAAMIAAACTAPPQPAAPMGATPEFINELLDEADWWAGHVDVDRAPMPLRQYLERKIAAMKDATS